MTEQEHRVFQSLAGSTEGDILSEYLTREMAKLRDDIIDNPDSSLADLAGARFARKVLQDFKMRLTQRARMTTEVDQLS